MLRLGRLRERRALGPGLVFFLPCTDEFRIVDTRIIPLDIEPQEILTKDSVTIQVEAALYFR